MVLRGDTRTGASISAATATRPCHRERAALGRLDVKYLKFTPYRVVVLA